LRFLQLLWPQFRAGGSRWIFRGLLAMFLVFVVLIPFSFLRYLRYSRTDSHSYFECGVYKGHIRFILHSGPGMPARLSSLGALPGASAIECSKIIRRGGEPMNWDLALRPRYFNFPFSTGPQEIIRQDWTVPVWMLAAMSALPLATRGSLRRKATPAGWCARCGYDLQATPEQCPECGTVAVNSVGDEVHSPEQV
jgi:hypothetical protein